MVAFFFLFMFSFFLQQATPLSEVNYFTKNPERAARMADWSGIIKRFQDGLMGMPEGDKMLLPGMAWPWAWPRPCGCVLLPSGRGRCVFACVFFFCFCLFFHVL